MVKMAMTVMVAVLILASVALAEDWVVSKGNTVTFFKAWPLSPCLTRQVNMSASDQNFKQTHAKKQEYSNGYFSRVTYDTCNGYQIVDIDEGWFTLEDKDLRFDGNRSAKLKANVVLQTIYGPQGLLKIDLVWKGTKTFQESHGQIEGSDGDIEKFQSFWRKTNITGSIQFGSEVFGGNSDSAIYQNFYRFPIDIGGGKG